MVPTDCAQDSGKKSAHEPLGDSPEDLPTGPAGTPKALSARLTFPPPPLLCLRHYVCATDCSGQSIFRKI